MPAQRAHLRSGSSAAADDTGRALRCATCAPSLTGAISTPRATPGNLRTLVLGISSLGIPKVVLNGVIHQRIEPAHLLPRFWRNPLSSHHLAPWGSLLRNLRICFRTSPMRYLPSSLLLPATCASPHLSTPTSLALIKHPGPSTRHPYTFALFPVSMLL